MEKGLGTLMANVKETDEQISKLNDELKGKTSKLEEEKSKFIGELKNRIKKGESTGDKIRDYIIISTGGLYFGGLESPLRDLNVEIEQHQNEQIVLLYKSEHDMVKHLTPQSDKLGLFGLSATITEIKWKFGVLEGELGFNYNSNEGAVILIPTKNYIKSNDSKNLKLESGCISIKGYELSNQLNFPGENLEILIGNNLVELYFKNPTFPIDLLKKYAKNGNAIEKDIFKDERSYKKYTEALKMLGYGKEEVTPAVNTDDLLRRIYK